jgi:hypothetical protein
MAFQGAALMSAQRNVYMGSQMKPIRLMSCVMARSLTLVPLASAQTQPTTAPPATQTQPSQQQQYQHPKASTQRLGVPPSSPGEEEQPAQGK